jgi:L-ascorbate metabolism protein UlaG (beta-lactamase superfamily)
MIPLYGGDMKLTKYEHACLVLSVAGEHLVIDPGSYLAPPSFTNVAAVVITHKHQDHWTPENLARILDDSPDARVFGPADLAPLAAPVVVEVVADGDVVEVGAFSLRFFGEKHQLIHETVPVIDNVGVLVNDALYYPGDSYTVPGVPIATLAAPIGAPWLKIGDAIDFILAVAPDRAFYTHDMTLSAAGRAESGPRLDWATTQGGGQYIALDVGESLDL